MNIHILSSISNFKFINSVSVKIILFLAALMLFPVINYSQDEVPTPPMPHDTVTTVKKPTIEEDSTYRNMISGEFTPGKGFDIVQTKWGSLNISGYGLLRWIDQIPNEGTFTDHLGNIRPVKGRNDIYFHRGMLWITGFIGVPRLRYNLTLWGLGTTQQTLLFGNVQYIVGSGLRVGAGVSPNLGIRSLQGSWPFWNGSDRQMGEESLRPGFTQSFWLAGECLPRLYYNFSVGDNLSILGATATSLTRDLSTSGSVWWMPTTGEFGPRGGNHDLENHTQLATRFGASFVHARDSKQNSASDSLSNNTQVKTTDGINLYERGALANGVTVLFSDFNMGSLDLGLKYRGWFFQVQYFIRNLSRFDAVFNRTDTVAPSIPSSLLDQTIQGDISYMLIPYTLCGYVSGTYLFDDFKRYPYEICAGLDYFPLHKRSWRLNAHFIYVTKSPASSSFGYYIAGQTGPTLSISTDFLF